MLQRIFAEVHTDLPREGPGNRESTARALATLAPLPVQPQILDIACGPGMQTVHLAELAADAQITAVDAHAPFLEAARTRAAAAGVAERIVFAPADMRALPFEDGACDLLWCEGAAYNMGIEAALSAWRRLLKPGGGIAFTEAVWLTDSRPGELERWWLDEYPDMDGIEACLARVQRSGFSPVAHFVLPESAWWDDYYRPMEARLGRLRSEHAADPAALTELAVHQQEIDCYRRWSEHYGYLFVSARPDRDDGAGTGAA